MRTVKAAVAALLLGGGLALGALAPAAAHQAPCDEATDPGHSEYARHHVVPLATAGELGNDGHVPGTHQGYAGLCGVLAP
jgi:hypothetical protein